MADLKPGFWVYDENGIWTTEASSWFKHCDKLNMKKLNYTCPVCREYFIQENFTKFWGSEVDIGSRKYNTTSVHMCGAKLGIAKK
jgi:hypothetical protein